MVRDATHETTEVARPAACAELVLVSNRLPVTMSNEGREVSLRPSTGGLATALSTTHARGASRWVGWLGDTQELSGLARAALREELARARLDTVSLTPLEVKRFYEGFSNSVLWPLFHYFVDKVRLDADRDWEVYRNVNARFAERVAAIAARGATVWVHDYQLMLVPMMLRALRPDLRIGFFLHVPFPAQEVFRVLPWREDLLRGVLGADLIGFHTQSYQHHFVTSAAHVLGTDVDHEAIEWQGRNVRIGAFPIGIDAERFASMARSESCQARVRDLRRQAAGRTLVLGIDRLDYTKGIPRRLLSIERLLEQTPALRERIHVVQVAVPTRDNVAAYAAYRRTVNEHVGRINGAHGDPTTMPIHLLHRALGFEELVALYSSADVMVVTPLRDGMNLVAKEYCASRRGDDGVLVLSELAGAAHELSDALLVNPYDIGGVAAAIQRAVEMPCEESARRMRGLRRAVEANHVESWAETFLRSLSAHVAEPRSQGDSFDLDGALRRAHSARQRLWLIDYDGTLAPYATTPDRAVPDKDLLELLASLAALPGSRVEIVSGRSSADLDAWFGRLPVGLHAEHGFMSRSEPGAPWVCEHPLDVAWKTSVRATLERTTGHLVGAFIEEKSASIVWHYRRVLPEIAAKYVAELRVRLSSIAETFNLRVVPGARSIEVRSAEVSKASVASRLAAAASWGAIIAAGDDATDEDMFRALPTDAITIKVGRGISVARFRVDDVATLRSKLVRFTRDELSG